MTVYVIGHRVHSSHIMETVLLKIISQIEYVFLIQTEILDGVTTDFIAESRAHSDPVVALSDKEPKKSHEKTSRENVHKAAVPLHRMP